MEKFSFTALANEIKDIKEEGITFEDKQLTWDTAEDVKDVVSALENTNVVHFMKLEGNTLGIEAAAAIGKALESHGEFRKALWRNMFTRRLKSEIPVALKHLGQGLQVAKAQLAVLDLSDNALGPNGMVGLEELLRSPVCYTLQELRLNNCGLGIGGGRMLSDALLDCLKNSTAAGTPLQLKVFVAGRNRLENEGAKSIAKIFANLKTLEEITMPQNSIYHEGIKALAAGFKECPQLQTLNLNDNTITHVGATYIADAIKSTPHLRQLNLGDCLLKTDGAYILAEALEQSHEQLEIVELDCNEIGPDGGCAFASALLGKAHLMKVNLNGNEFGNDACQRIAQIISKDDVLTPFDDDEGESEGDEDNDGDFGEEEEDDEDYEEHEEEGAYSTEHDNDSTEEADEEDVYRYDEDDDEAAYITSEAFNTKTNFNTSGFNTSSSFFADTTQTMTPPATGNVSATESFCLNQSPCNLYQYESLTGDKYNTLKEYINLFNGDNHLLVFIFTALKCANLSQNSTSALEVSKKLFRDLIEHAVEIKQERRVINYLLKQLGLLRSERKFKTSYDQASCCIALREALQDYKVPSEYMDNVLKVFLQEAQETAKN